MVLYIVFWLIFVYNANFNVNVNVITRSLLQTITMMNNLLENINIT